MLLGVVFQQRGVSSRRALKRLLEEEVLGALHRVSMSVAYYRPQAYYNAAPWRGTWRGEGGGVLMNQAMHALDQMAWLCGSPRSVFARTLTREHQIEVENTVFALLNYGPSLAGSFHTSTIDALPGERIEICGDLGALVWEDGRLRHLQLEQSMSRHLREARHMFEDIRGQWRDIECEPTPVNSDYRAVLSAFARAVRCGDESLLLANGEDGRRALEMANALLFSGQNRCEVTLPLDSGRYEEMLRALQNDEGRNNGESGAGIQVLEAQVLERGHP